MSPLVEEGHLSVRKPLQIPPRVPGGGRETRVGPQGGKHWAVPGEEAAAEGRQGGCAEEMAAGLGWQG